MKTILCTISRYNGPKSTITQIVCAPCPLSRKEGLANKVSII